MSRRADTPRPLGTEELATLLAPGSELAAWQLEGDRELRRKLRFESFAAAIAFMAQLAPTCDALDHHPRWSNLYDQLDVALTTHSAGNRITARDLQLALSIERAFRGLATEG